MRTDTMDLIAWNERIQGFRQTIRDCIVLKKWKSDNEESDNKMMRKARVVFDDKEKSRMTFIRND